MKEYDIIRYSLSSILCGIKQRCNNSKNKNWKNYGGRGIQCEWKNISEFCNDMQDSYKKGLSIDRIDVNGNYCKENCRWVTMKEQGRNKRKTIYIDGITLIEFCENKNIKYNIVRQRIKILGWSIDMAINKPIRYKKTNKLYIQ